MHLAKIIKKKEGENEWQEIRRKEMKRKKSEDILNMLFIQEKELGNRTSYLSREREDQHDRTSFRTFLAARKKMQSHLFKQKKNPEKGTKRTTMQDKK